MIRYSCHSENFGRLSAPETFKLIRSLEFDCIDVASRSLVPQAEILENPKQCARRLKDLSRQFELPLSELFLSAVELEGQTVSPVCARSRTSGFENAFETICTFADMAGFSSIMGYAGAVDPELGFSSSFDQAARTLKRQADIASRHGLAFHVEPSRTSLLNTVQAALDMVQAAPGLGYTLDFLHYQINGIPQKESIKLLPHAGHLHARQAKKGMGKCDFTEGEIDYAQIVQELKRQNWSGDIAMEFWSSKELAARGVQAVEQNIVMRYCLKTLFGR